MDELIARYADLPPRQRYIGFGVLLLAIVGAYYYWVYDAQNIELARLRSDADQLMGQTSQKEANVNSIAHYESRIAELQDALTVTRSQLPDDANVPELLSQLGNKARQAGLNIERFEPKGEGIQDFYAEINFDMKVHGSYHEIASFIDSVGKLDRIVNVTDLSMKNPKDVSQKVILDGSFTIKTYRFIEGLPDAKKGKGKK